MDVSSTLSDPANSGMASGETAPSHRRLGANQAFFLNRSAGAWRVAAGAIDLFLTVPPPEGSGTRWHGFRVEAGGLVLSVVSSAKGRVDWVAVPTAETELIEVPLDVAVPADRAARTAWVQRLTRLVKIGRVPPAPVRLERYGEISPEPGQALCGGSALRWLSVLEGRVLIADIPGLPLAPASAPFPFIEDLWYLAEPETRVRICDLDIATLDGAAGPAYLALVAAVETAHLLRDAGMLADEASRLAHRRLANGRAEREGRNNFTGVLDPLARAHWTSVEPGQDPLVTVVGLVARHQNIDFRAPRQLPPRDLPTLNRLTQLLHEGGILWRRVLLDGTWWTKDVGTFCAIRTGDGTPVVVRPAARGRYEIFDPATGQQLALDESAVALLDNKGFFLNRPFPSGRLTGRRLLDFGLTGRRRDIWIVLLVGLASGLISLLTPLVTSTIIGDIIPAAALDQLWQYTFLLVSMTLSAGIFGLAQALILVRVSGHLDSVIQGALWDRLMRLPVGFFRGYTAGDLASRAMGINTINSTMTTVTLSSILSGIFASLNFVLMLWYAWQLSLIGLAIVIVTLLVALGLTLWQLAWQRRVTDSQGRLTGLVLQLIGGINKLRVAHAESRAFSVWSVAYAEQNRLKLKADGLNNALTVFNAAVPTIAAIIMFIAIAAILGTIGLGDFIAFNAAFTQFFSGVVALTAAVGSCVSVMPLYRRARPILDAIPEVDQTKQAPGDLSGRITLDHVSFAYDTEGRPTLDDITLNIAPGEFVAIVGPSGSGKSTLLRLLMGFERPSGGVIAFDNKDLTTLDVQAVRQQLGIVVQNSQIMPGNVFQNITGNNPGFTVADAWDAAALAGLDQDIKAMPMGMETFIAEGATTISMGQRQRLMIARAMIRRPRIMMFDEATSALDNRAQAIVTDSLSRLKATRIVIAQRLSTIVDADRIYVMADGRIRQSGTYAELTAVPGLFRDFAARQLA